jgi:hypothetical protein
MNSTTNGRDEDEKEILADEISDEALDAPPLQMTKLYRYDSLF